MTTTARPSLERKVTRKTEENRTSQLEAGARITIEGESYEVRMGDMTAPLARELRRQYGGSLQKLITEMSDDPDIDTFATFVWLARRIRGEEVSLDSVEIDYAAILADGFDVSVPGDDSDGDGEDSPEG